MPVIASRVVMAALGVAYVTKKAYVSTAPEEYFTPFLILFLIVFAATGIGNGSSLRTIANVFDKRIKGDTAIRTPRFRRLPHGPYRAEPVVLSAARRLREKSLG